MTQVLARVYGLYSFKPSTSSSVDVCVGVELLGIETPGRHLVYGSGFLTSNSCKKAQVSDFISCLSELLAT
jgi:hypothetical protein